MIGGVGPETVAIELRARDLASRDIAQVGASLQHLGDEIAATEQRAGLLSRAANGLFNGVMLGAGMAALNAVVSGVHLAKEAFIGYNAALEQSEMAFTTMLGSGEKAKKFLEELQKFAAVTPFEFQGLVASTQQLLAYGFAAEDVVPMLRAVGDAAAGLGGDTYKIQLIIRALGQMQAKAKVASQEMLQLTEQGIPAWEILAEKMGKPIPEIQKLVSKGLIPANKAIDYLIEGMEERFPGMMMQQSKTFQGAISTIKDSIQILASTAVRPLFNLLSAGMYQLATLLSSGTLLAGAKAIAAGLQKLIDLVSGWIAPIAKAGRAFVDQLVAPVTAGLRALGDDIETIKHNWEFFPGFFNKLDLILSQFIVMRLGLFRDQWFKVTDAMMAAQAKLDEVAASLAPVASAVQNLVTVILDAGVASSEAREAFGLLRDTIAGVIERALTSIGVWDDLKGVLDDIKEAQAPLIRRIDELLDSLARSRDILLGLRGPAGDVADALRGLAGAALDLDRADLTSQFEALQGSVGQFGSAFMEAIAEIKPEDVAKQLGSVAAGLALGPWTTAVYVLNQNKESIAATVTEAYSQIAGVVGGLLANVRLPTIDPASIIESFVAGIGERLQTVAIDVAGLVSFIGPKLLDVLAAAFNWVVDHTDEITFGLAGILERVFDWFVGVAIPQAAQWVTQAANAFLDQLVVAAEGFGDALPTIISGLIKVLGDVLGAVLEFIGQKGPVIAEKLVEWAAAFAGWVLGDALPRLLAALAALLPRLVGAIIGAVPQIAYAALKLAIGFGQSLVKGVTDATANAAAAVADFIVRLPGILAGAVPALISWGLDMVKAAGRVAGDIVKGLINGLGTLASDLIKALRSAFMSIKIDIGPFHIRGDRFWVDLPEIKLPGFDVGAWKVPKTMVAVVHKGEMIIPERMARILRGEAMVSAARRFSEGVESMRLSSAAVAPAPAMSVTIVNNFGPGSVRSDEDIRRIDRALAERIRLLGFGPAVAPAVRVAS